VQHLDGHVSIVTEIARQVDRSHATGTEFALDPVPSSKSDPQAFKDVH
jgi:hypothetical protein